MIVSLPYQPALDGLRVPAVFAVMLFHAIPDWLPGGFLGVDVFFVLSGYLITSLLLQELEVTGRMNLAGFFIRRWFRLAPALILLLLVYGFTVQLWAPVRPAQEQVADIVYAALYISNWARVYALSELTDLGHTWSLAVEAQFYLIWPLLLWISMQLAPRGFRLLWLVLGGVLASMSVRAWIWLQDASTVRLYNGLDTRVETLLWGAALAIYLRQARPEIFNSGKAAGACVASILGLMFFMHWTSAWYYLSGLSLVAAMSAYLIGYLAFNPASNLGRVLSEPVIVWLGVISYGLYLWHFPIYRMLLAFDFHDWSLLASGLALTVPVAAVSYYFLEKPLLNRRKTSEC